MLSKRIFGFVPVSVGMALAASNYLVIGEIAHSSNSLFMINLAVIIAGVICCAVAFSVASLASKYPTSPGVRTWTKKAFGNQISLTLTIFLLMLVGIFAGVESYVIGKILEMISPDISLLMVTITIFTAVVVINGFNLEIPKTIQSIFAYSLILTMIVIGITGVSESRTEVVTAWNSAVRTSDLLRNLPGIVGMAIFLFMGFEWVAPLGRHKEDYQRNIPAAMVIALLLLILMYIVFIAGMTSVISPTSMKTTELPHVVFGTHLFSDVGLFFMFSVSVVAMFTTFNAGLMGASRLVYALARENVFPKYCARISLKTGAPIGGVITISAFALMVSIIEIVNGLQVQSLIICSAIYCTIYSSIVLAEIIERKKHQYSTFEHHFKNPIPTAIKYGLATLLVIVGIMSLDSVSEYRAVAVSGYLVLFVMAWLLAKILIKRSTILEKQPEYAEIKEIN